MKLILHEKVKEAYLRLKRYYYHDTNALLEIRLEIATFESNNYDNLENIFKEIAENITNQNYDSYLSQIKSTPVLKKIIKDDENKNGLIINDYTVDKYDSERNYVIYAPIEVLIISMLWVMEVGKNLDKTFYSNALGQRLRLDDDEFETKFSNKFTTFSPYFTQYQTWRDQAIKETRHILKDDDDDAILISLDIEKFFYNVTNIKALEIDTNSQNDLGKNLSQFVDSVNIKFKEDLNSKEEAIKKNKKKIYLDEKSKLNSTPLPVGLPSSMILANYALKELDKRILDELSPNYYGRYVDDIILVFKKSKEVLKELKLESTKDYLTLFLATKKPLFKMPKSSENKIQIVTKGLNLNVQLDKLKIYHFKSEDGSPLLDIFEKEIRLNTSIFNILPEEDELMESFNKNAFSIQYSGSLNKLSSIRGISDNKFKLSVYLSKAINFHKDSSFYSNDEFKKEILQFFRGKYLVEYSLLWEKIFTYFLVVGEFKESLKLYFLILKEIEKFTDKGIIINLKKVLKSSLAMSLALNINITKGFKAEIKSLDLVNEIEEVEGEAEHFINSNLFRHRIIKYTLTSYVASEGSCFSLRTNFLENNNFKEVLSERKLKYTPRRIHLDDFILYFFKYQEHNSCGEFIKPHINYIDKAFEKFNEVSDFKIKNKFNSSPNEPKKINNFSINSHKIDLNRVKIGLANLKLKDSYFIDSLKEKPNLSFNRKAKIFKILNEAKKSKVDILIFSEVSIPFEWLGLIAEFSRRNNMAITLGLDHILENSYASNYLVTILPYSVSKHYQTSFIKFRLKNHYAPEEAEYIKGYYLKVPKLENSSYDLFNWNNIYFTNFNCFELTSILDRSQFMGKIDLLIASVFNRDKMYFKEILTSTSRDLHSYVAQVNNSKYGDSMLLKPSKKDFREIASITGGDNAGLLVGTININSIREFQRVKYSIQKSNKSFKPTPPGFKLQDVLDRINNE